jgi:hypothetical protein
VSFLERKTGTRGLALAGKNPLALARPAQSESYAALCRDGKRHWIGFWDFDWEELKRVSLAARPDPTAVFSPDGRMLLAAGKDGSISLLDLLTGAEVLRIPGVASTVAMSPDGRTFASGSYDGTVSLWDLTTLFAPAGRSSEDLLRDLKGADSAKAFRAQWALVAGGDTTVRMLRPHWEVPFDRPKAIRLLADLDARSYAVRNRATAELARMGPGLTPLLVEQLQKPPSLESRRRLEQLLRECRRLEMPPENLWRFRAIALIEQIGTGEAQREVTRMAASAPGWLLLRETRLALKRLQSRSP